MTGVAIAVVYDTHVKFVNVTVPEPPLNTTLRYKVDTWSLNKLVRIRPD